MSDMNEQLVQEVEVKEKKKKAPFIIGLIVIIFAVIGIVSVGMFIKDSVSLDRKIINLLKENLKRG